MKKLHFIILGLLIFIGVNSFAQDTIITLEGEEIVAKIDKITPFEIHYFKIEMPDGPLYIKNVSEVFIIKLSNGTKLIYGDFDAEGKNITLPDYNAVTWARLGAQHADEYYPGQNALIATSATTFFAPFGTIPLLIYYMTSKPKFNPEKLPNPEYFQQPEYQDAFLVKAKNKNIGNAFAGVALGILPFVILVLINNY